MANNIIGGSPNAVVAKQTISFFSAGITSVNTAIIYVTDTASKTYKSYVPGRGINAITGFEAGKGYIIVALVDFDLTSIAVPPLDVPSAPAITQQPATQSVSQGQTFTLSILATGTAPLTYQWRKDGSNISGETNNSIVVANAQSANAGVYTCVASNAFGSATSSGATVTVNVVAQLSTPVNFSNVVVTGSQINLDWDNVPNATTYVLQRATDPGFNTGLTTIYTGGTSAYNDTGANATIQNYYRVKAQASGYTDSAYATTSNSSFDANSLTGQPAIYESDVANIVLSGSDVSQWNDISGNGNNIAQPTSGNRPAYITTGGPNNKNFLRFAAGDYMDLMPGPITASPVSYYMVTRVNSFVNNAYILLTGVENGANGVQIDTAAKVLRAYTGVAPFPEVRNNPAYRNSWMLLKYTITDSHHQELSVNDEPPLRVAAAGTPTVMPTNALKYIGIRVEGDVAALRVFNRILTTQEDADLRSAMMVKYGVQSPPKLMLAFGDSHTFGVKSGTPDGPTYMQLLTNNTSMFAYNYGISGTVVTPFSTGQTAGQNLIDKTSALALSRYNNCWVHFQYGTNDAAISGQPQWGTVATWKAAYKAEIQKFISAGFSPSKIVICTPPYSTAAYPNIVAGRFSAIATAVREIASEMSINLADFWAAMELNGYDCATTGDQIHMNGPMHQICYQELSGVTGL